MTETFVAHVNGSHACYVTSTGIDRAYIGCAHDTPREAIDHSTREEDSHARIPADRIRREVVDPEDVIPTSRSVPDRATPSSGGEWDSVPEQNEAPGHPIDADGPRRLAPTGTFPPGPVGAPSPERVP